MTNTIQNQRIFTLTILNCVMTIASAIKIFIIAPIAQQTIITLATIQNIITEFGLQLIIAVTTVYAVIKIAANQMIVAILAINRAAMP